MEANGLLSKHPSALETLYGGQFMMSSQLIKPDYLQLILGKISVYQILHGKSIHMVFTQEKIEQLRARSK